jgi:hypothetical protein
VEIAGHPVSLIAISMLAGCSATQALVGSPRAPLTADQVQVYLEAPARFDKIAILASSSQFSFALSADAKTEAVIQRLKRAAAKLGANGILLQGINDEAAASIGGGAGASAYSNHGTLDLGVGGFTSGARKYGSGLAIYVEPARTP